jgi:hypothetical protein
MLTGNNSFVDRTINVNTFRTIDGISEAELGAIQETNLARGVYLRLINYQELIHRISVEPVFLNDLDTETKAGKERLVSLTRSNYEGDSLSIIPSCECGELRGERKKGRCCKICQTNVVSAAEKPIESNVWIRPPKDIDSLMNPMAWTILADAFTSSGLNILEWICDDKYQPPESQMFIIDRLRELGIGVTSQDRGWNYFCRNFDLIIDILISHKFCRKTNKDHRDSVFQFYRENRELFFTPYLPIPNKIAFVTEKTPVGIYADSGMKSAQDAIQTITSIDESEGGTNLRSRENKTCRTIMQLAAYYDHHCRTVIGKKEGWFRKHVFGTRVPYAGRTVITSLACRHHYDELHIPWTYAVSLFRIHLTNKLFRLGYSPKQTNTLIIQAANQWSPLFADLFKELIAEAPGLGIACILHRNPTLARGSAQHFYITKVKDNVDINSISMSTLTLKAPN